MKSRHVLPSTARRDWLLSLSVAAVFIALILYALMNFSGGVSGSTLTGKIVEKHFTPQPEERVTIGTGGVYARHS